MIPKVTLLAVMVCASFVPIAKAQNNTPWPTSGNVGIGTTSPDAKLQVANGSVFVSGDSGALTTTAGAGLVLKYYTGNSGNALIFGYDYSNSVFKNLSLQSAGGSVSIGIIGPATNTNARLVVAQGDSATGLAIANNSGVGRLALNGNGDGSWTAYDNATGNWSPGITQKAGNVGIGITGPEAKLQVANGSVFVTGDSGALSATAGAGLALKYYNENALIFGYDYSNSIFKNLSLQSAGGNVSIGMIGPVANTNARLVVAQGDNVTGLAIANNSGVGRLALNGNGDGSWTAYDNATGNWSLGITQKAGHVGIGMSPGAGYSLDVAGSIHATQVIGATYQDVAEWVPATAKMSPGTVVVVQRSVKNTVMPSASEYATSVAGVVSDKPGLILGESSETKAMIATTGRVRVHVDASSGAIEAGDLLVTSSKPGMAMKSQPVDLGGVKIHRPGTLIGKALESLPSGEGDILVLLSLQ